MPDTINALPIPGTWTDLNTLSGITVGSAINIQNIGSSSGAIANIGTPNSIIEITTSSSEPADSFIGWHVSLNEQWEVSAGELKVWVKFSKLGGAEVGSETCNVKVMQL